MRSRNPAYNVWQQIKARCLNPRNKNYPEYGARGITMYPEWVSSFPAFLGAVGPRPSPKHSIDRIDGTRGYVPGNVRWATASEQARNRPTFVRMLEHQGRRQTIVEWAQEIGIPPPTLYNRIRNGWPVARALTEPSGTMRRDSHLLTVGGRTQTLPAWAREKGLRIGTLRERLRRGWPPEKALDPLP